MTLLKHTVQLSTEDRAYLERLVSTGKHPVRIVTRARILLKADSTHNGPGWDDQKIVEAFECGARTVARVRKRYVALGLYAALQSKRPVGRKPKLSKEQCERLLDLYRSPPPTNHPRWTMKCLAERLVSSGVVTSIDPATVWRTLQKLKSNGRVELNQLEPVD